MARDASSAGGPGPEDAPSPNGDPDRAGSASYAGSASPAGDPGSEGCADREGRSDHENDPGHEGGSGRAGYAADPIASIDFSPMILAYCKDSIGKKIGNGECGALAAAALKNAGAAARGGPDSPGDGDYVWGKLVASIKAGFYGASGVKALGQVESGDIVQFHNARFAGYDHAEYGVYRLDVPHHTAVIESVDIRHKKLGVVHQNWNGEKLVRRQTLYLGGMTRGWLRIYHPILPPTLSTSSWR